MLRTRIIKTVVAIATLAATSFSVGANAQAPQASDKAKEVARVKSYWTAERIKSATPRDLLLDDRGFAYLRGGNGELLPYGHSRVAENAAAPRAKPGSGPEDTTPPTVSDMSPGEGATTTSPTTFSASVIDEESGIRSVSIQVRVSPAGSWNSFNASSSGNNVYSVSLTIADGAYEWRVVAKDGAKKGGDLLSRSICGSFLNSKN